jgi:hypothetical protein
MITFVESTLRQLDKSPRQRGQAQSGGKTAPRGYRIKANRTSQERASLTSRSFWTRPTCVVDRDGAVVYEGKSASMAEAIADEMAKAPSCRRIVFETGRMAPILSHGLSQLGLPCVESRQAYQALKSLATHKTDRNDARELAHLARTGFFKPVHVKSFKCGDSALSWRFWAIFFATTALKWFISVRRVSPPFEEKHCLGEYADVALVGA